MSPSPAQLRFLHRTRRRWIAWRIIESAGICAAVGAGVAMIVVLVLMSRTEDAIKPALVLLSLGASAGVIWGISRRPTLFQTALMADEQLGLHDLLSTSISTQQWENESFRCALLEHAEAVCARLSPDELIVRKLGGRAWGGIGISSALVLVFAMMSGQPMRSQASIDEIEEQSPAVIAVSPFSQPESVARIDPQIRRTDSAPDRKPSNDEEGDGDPSRFGQAGGSSRQSNITISGDGTGSSAGHTEDGKASSPPQRRVGDSSSSSEGTLVAGGGQAGQPGLGDPTSGSTTESIPSVPTPPWRSENWSADREAAEQAIINGRIPDPYRDLVRDYFQIESR